VRPGEHNRRRSLQGHPILLRVIVVMSLFLPAAIRAQAQVNVVSARVRSFTGIALIRVGLQSAAFAPKRNALLEPGNVIETGPKSHVVISLSDGGQITILPNSKVVLKNFRVAHLARELLDIIVGRVRVKIRSVGGKPNHYRLNSPAASIAVRGTEFIVDVLPGGETLVVVREGLVEVWSHNNPDNKRMVTPGRRVIVRPGGDISSAFPGPGSGLNGRTRVSMGEDYRRSVDSVAQNSNEITPAMFSAFPDQHLDSLENPAYASDFKSAEGRLFMLPSASKPYWDFRTSKDDPRLDYSISPQLTFFTPIPGSRFVVGAGVSAFAVRSENRSDSYFRGVFGIIADPNQGVNNHFRQSMRFNALNVSFAAAYSFGDHGKTSVGIGLETLSGTGNYLEELVSSSEEYFDGNWDNLHSRFARTRLTIGLTRRFSDSAKLGLYYRHGITSSDQENQHRDEHSNKSTPKTSRFEHVKMSTSNLSSEIGARFRAALTKRLFYGGEAAYLYERINSRGDLLSHSLHDRYRYLARRARLGMGVGFALNSKTFLNFDVTGGIFNNDRPPQTPINSSGALISYSLSPGSLSSVQGKFLSAHVAAQTNLWRNLYLSASGLKMIRKDLLYIRTLRYTYLYTSDNGIPVYHSEPAFEYYNAVDKGDLSNYGVGWKFKPNLTAEYVYSVDHNYRDNSHSFKIRYSFNLGITGEK
jgi:FecR protein